MNILSEYEAVELLSQRSASAAIRYYEVCEQDVLARACQVVEQTSGMKLAHDSKLARLVEAVEKLEKAKMSLRAAAMVSMPLPMA